MRFLLDTQVALWLVGPAHRLGPSARSMLVDPGTGVSVSVVSLWEIVVKRSIGKLHVDLDCWEELTSRGVDTLPVLTEHARAVADLPLHHRDPFDRMLIAQARSEGLTLLTSDRRFEEYSVATFRADK